MRCAPFLTCDGLAINPNGRLSCVEVRNEAPCAPTGSLLLCRYSSPIRHTAAVASSLTYFHDLRHFGNLLAAEAGASTRELMKRLGQSTMRAALGYQHATEKRDKEIASLTSVSLRLCLMRTKTTMRMDLPGC